MNPNKHTTALSVRYEYATHGHETQESMRAYVENRISMTVRNNVVKEGLRIYEGKGAYKCTKLVLLVRIKSKQ